MPTYLTDFIKWHCLDKPPGSRRRLPPCLADSSDCLRALGDSLAGLPPTAVMDPAAWRRARAPAAVRAPGAETPPLGVGKQDAASLLIKYTGFRDRPHEERQARFQNACRDGRSEIAFVATGTNLSLQFFPASWQGEQRQTPSREYVDLEREAGKVYLKAPMILNGVCVIWKGWIDLQRLDGMGCLEFDEERAQQEDALAQQAFEEVRRRTREFEDRDRSHREEMEVRVSQLLAVTGKKTTRP
ncbi:core-binding factor subunit beta [Pteropus alecto]|uniref:core-binding factor subunit beta n=1 Tax=Pteropus alecto TaxID=9402 RepID=UPI000D538BAB|nr:core-binding factor subunit beta [Pteropus alecto]